MTIDSVAELCRNAVMMTLTISAPVLVVGVVVALAISILQAVTQIQDQTVSIVGKIVVMLLTMVYVLPWTLTQLIDYSTRVIAGIPGSLH